MVHIKRYILIILTCLFIQSCSSAAIDEQRVQGGKVSFMSGDFKSAFHQLLPLAAEGIPQAEYGVGYMYYYGYGVTQDTESGIFWMNKAAAAHYAPAIRALHAIQENNIKQAGKRKYPNESAPPKINTRAENTRTGNNIDKDAILEALNTDPASRKGHVTVMSQPDQTTLAEADPKSPTQQGHVTIMPQEDHTTLVKAEPQQEEKIIDYAAVAPKEHVTMMSPDEQTKLAGIGSQLHQKISDNTANATSKKYTLQLLGSYYLSSLKTRQAQLNLGAPTYIGQTKYNGRDWYVLTVGSYPALGNAELAKLDLPKKIKDYKPWIRKCDELAWVS